MARRHGRYWKLLIRNIFPPVNKLQFQGDIFYPPQFSISLLKVVEATLQSLFVGIVFIINFFSDGGGGGGGRATFVDACSRVYVCVYWWRILTNQWAIMKTINKGCNGEPPRPGQARILWTGQETIWQHVNYKIRQRGSELFWNVARIDSAECDVMLIAVMSYYRDAYTHRPNDTQTRLKRKPSVSNTRSLWEPTGYPINNKRLTTPGSRFPPSTDPNTAN